MRFLFYTLFYCIFLFSGANILHASNAEEELNSIQKTVTIPPPIQLANSAWLPAVNQFILMPAEGRILVYYAGIFNNGSKLEQSTKNFILPLPKGANVPSVMSVKLSEGVQQIQTSFTLNAPFGQFDWRPHQLTILPGVTILMINDNSAKILMNSADFIQDFQDKSFNGKQFVRVSWDKNTAYPIFKITNLIPSRAFIYGCIVFVGVVLFSSLWLFVRMIRKQ